MSLIFIIALLSGVVADDFEVSPNVVYDSTTAPGILLGFIVGQYDVHPVLLDENGDARSFWSTDPLLDYFLSRLVGERVFLEIEESDSYIGSVPDVMRIFRVIDASTGNLSYFQWRDSLETEGDPEELLGDYHAAPYNCLVEVPD
ncbi:MAG: hypothetical protein ABFR50_03385 [Candidatus Fermentibacteria bacterium]